MEHNMSKQPAKLRHTRLVRTLGLGLLLAIVVLVSVGATVLILNSTGHLTGFSTSAPTTATRAATSVPGQTPTPASPTVVRGSLYTAEVGSLTRIDLQTGKVVWTIDAT